tara:strand:- start:791 stop:976 length:186 start_codon:yes stop_codon:yes gene_type:complete
MARDAHSQFMFASSSKVISSWADTGRESGIFAYAIKLAEIIKSICKFTMARTTKEDGGVIK